MQESGLGLLGTPLKKNAPCCLPQGGVEMIALYHFLATESTKRLIKILFVIQPLVNNE
jgi:hypothetical protein